MDYDKYIFDWQNRLLEKSEYADTRKYAFSLLNVAQMMLNKHIDTYSTTETERENLEKINKLLEKLYQETSHIELEFNSDF